MSKPCPGGKDVDARILDAAHNAELAMSSLANVMPEIKNLNQDSMSKFRVELETIERKVLEVEQAYRRQMDTLNLQAHGGFQKK